MIYNPVAVVHIVDESEGDLVGDFEVELVGDFEGDFEVELVDDSVVELVVDYYFSLY